MIRPRDMNFPERFWVLLLLASLFHYILQKVRGLVERII
jgi:hypothetical protein